MPTPAYLAGLTAARQSVAETVKWIVPPDSYTADERSDFVSGFMAGARVVIEEEDVGRQRVDSGQIGGGV